jgi:hypothetical protein
VEKKLIIMWVTGKSGGCDYHKQTLFSDNVCRLYNYFIKRLTPVLSIIIKLFNFLVREINI